MAANVMAKVINHRLQQFDIIEYVTHSLEKCVMNGMFGTELSFCKKKHVEFAEFRVVVYDI